MTNGIKHWALPRSVGGLGIGLAVVGLLTVFASAEPESGDRVTSANRLENQGITAWNEGRYEEGARLIESAIENDPTSPQRALNYGSLLMIRGQQQLQAGAFDDAARTLDRSESYLTAAVRMAEGLPGKRALAGHGFYLLGEIAFFARKDQERASKFYQSAARRLPDDSRIEGALERVGVDASSMVEPDPVSKVAIGMANSVMIDGVRLRLETDHQEAGISVKEYLPLGETMENWTVLFARRGHANFVEPMTFTNMLAEKAAQQGCRILKTSKGPGDTANVAFVIHAPASQLSEVNVWSLFVENGTLTSEQFAHRVRGEDHLKIADALADRKVSDWITQLQSRRSTEIAQATEPASP